MDDQREFKINLHGDAPEDDAQETLYLTEEVPPPKKPVKGAMLVLLAIFAAAVFGGALFFVYDHLNSRIQEINARGSEGIACVSETLDNRYAELSGQFAAQMESNRSRLTDLESRLTAVKASVSTLDSGKLDKKDTTAIRENLLKDIQSKHIGPLQKSLENIQTEFSGITTAMAGVSETLKTLKTDISANKDAITALKKTAAETLDQPYLEKQLQKERDFHQQNMAHAMETLFSELTSLRKMLQDLETTVADIRAAAKPTPPAASGPATKAPSDTLAVPKPGEIIEQEIE